MTIEATVPETKVVTIAKKIWAAPLIQVLDIHSAEGSSVGPLCDKFGSLSATSGHDRCNPATK
jgi:hypothetical protein